MEVIVHSHPNSAVGTRIRERVLPAVERSPRPSVIRNRLGRVRRHIEVQSQAARLRGPDERRRTARSVPCRSLAGSRERAAAPIRPHPTMRGNLPRSAPWLWSFVPPRLSMVLEPPRPGRGDPGLPPTRRGHPSARETPGQGCGIVPPSHAEAPADCRLSNARRWPGSHSSQERVGGREPECWAHEVSQTRRRDPVKTTDTMLSRGGSRPLLVFL